MALTYFGNQKPASVTLTDIEILFTYTPNRITPPTNQQIFSLDPTSILIPYTDDGITGNNLIGGLYNMRLPKDNFNAVGVYTIFIRPKRIRTTIVDCGTLSGNDNIKGIVIDTSNLDKKNSSDYDGYLIEYFNSNGTFNNNTFRITTSSNRCELVSENLNNTSQKAIRYRFNEIGSLMFLTLTPSVVADFKVNTLPFIGQPGQSIQISNTFFKPQVLEVELVKNNADTLAIYIAGEQVKNATKGIITYYDENRIIFDQKNVFEIKDEFNNPLFDVKENRTLIEPEDFNAVIANVNQI